MKMIKNVILAFMLVAVPLSVVWSASLDEQLLDNIKIKYGSNLEKIQKLVKFGADVNVKDRLWGDTTALMYASKYNKLAIVKFLVENGAEVNAVDNDKRTALMYASSNGEDNKIVHYLLSKGADINAKDINGENALMRATSKYQWDIAKFLIEQGININNKNKNGNTALMWFAENGDLDKVQYLISKGADINAKNNDGKTAFMIALDKGKLEVAEFLESVGADTTRE